MLEFGVEVSTDELIALERALRGLDTDEARSALAKAHRTPVVLTTKERDAVLSALRALFGDTPAEVVDGWGGLARLAAALERAEVSEPDEPPPKPRARSARK